MKYYEISKHYYDSEEVHNYGGGYTAEEVKQIMKGLKKETLDFDPLTTFYTRRNMKYFYIVNEYNAE